MKELLKIYLLLKQHNLINKNINTNNIYLIRENKNNLILKIGFFGEFIDEKIANYKYNVKYLSPEQILNRNM